MTDRPVRVRFAPSPTGPLHIGGVRTALYNYLLARHTGGTMILRIEDTDQTRFVPGAEDYIRRSLEWCGIQLDESPWHGGAHAPYRQSERKALYMQYAQQLLDSGNAYYAFDTPEELEAMRERLKAEKVDFQYNGVMRMQMKNSLTLSADEVQRRIASGEPYVIRLKVPLKEEIRFTDLIRGHVVVQSSTIDDKVLMKSDGMPTYHLANVVDDHLMEISHVIRGEEWLPSAPLHVLLYRAFGWESTMPQFAHLPLLLKPEGEGKLSKRDGDKHGFAVFPLQWNNPETGESSRGFREDGYLPEALVNFLALLGWNPGTEQEIFSMEELIAAFSLERVNKSGAKFDINKAKWYNQQYIKEMSDEQLAGFLLQELDKQGLMCSNEKAVLVARAMKERITFIHELVSAGRFFFEAPVAYDAETVAKKWTADAAKALTAFAELLKGWQGEFTPAAVKTSLNDLLAQLGMKPGPVMPALRLAMTGSGGGPDLMDILTICGREETIRRIETAVKALA
ncbi:glutamate--tRNA ligase [Rhodoflexus caldus]|uniref:glutamate--tRNA ligase n=1 Tax=Rhodoflexus caldus TaxID=2891236 RepID=UPI00202A3318|nr:glutamate--tRNA ligase [Rhodoflexus caldus]